MAATTTATAAPVTTASNGQNGTTTLLQEESKIVASLADLQDLHEKLWSLRSLLPGRILQPLRNPTNPAAAAVAPSHPGADSPPPPPPFSPQSVLTSLTTAVKRGESELNDFKTLWQSEPMERARKRARVEYIGRGDDVFREDYRETRGALRRKLDREEEERVRRKGKKKGEGEGEKEEDPDVGRRDEEGGVEGVVERWRGWRAEGKVQVGIERVGGDEEDREEGEEGTMVFDVETGGMALTVRAKGEGERRTWEVKNREGAPCAKRKEGAIRCLIARKNKRCLEYLLEMLEAYANLFRGSEGACEACGRLFGRGSGAYPFVRRKKKVVDDKGSVSYVWGAYHEEQSCRMEPDGKKEGE